MVSKPQEYVAFFPIPNPLHHFTSPSPALPDADTAVPGVKHYPARDNDTMKCCKRAALCVILGPTGFSGAVTRSGQEEASEELFRFVF